MGYYEVLTCSCDLVILRKMEKDGWLLRYPNTPVFKEKENNSSLKSKVLLPYEPSRPVSCMAGWLVGWSVVLSRRDF